MIKANNYLVFRWSCEKKHIEIVKYLWETFKDPEMNKSYNYYGFRWACCLGQIEIVKYLCETFKDP